jgi:transcriptional regulator with XRE-family HTH domain
MAPSRDDDHSALALFAAELQAARTRAGMSQDELAARINYSPSLVGMVESMRRVPRLDFAQRCDEALATTGTFTRLHEHLRTAPFPSWFRPFAQHEAEATALRTFELVLVPGLLQTPEYARVLLSTRVGTSEEDVEQLVAARIERQAILDRDDPPLLWVVLDEGVLRRPIGDRKVMRAQVEHLVEMAGRPSVVIQVVPGEVGAHEGVNGSFVIADFATTPSIVYLETALTGLVVERPEDVAAVRLTYDTLRSEAMSRAASLELLQEVANTWT